MNWHTLKKEEVLEKLQARKTGLTQRQAAERLDNYGKNVIEQIYKVNVVKIFLKQFKSFLIYILLFAIAFSIFIKHYIDASVIGAIVLLNAAIGFIQQYKAERSIIKLRRLIRPKAKVFREGKLIYIKSEDLVPGDIIVLREGDKITSDCRILSLENLEVNEAILTGESVPVEKFDTVIRDKTILAERKNMLFSGTIVVKGSCKAIVVETGMTTEFGKIAKLLQEIRVPETPMQKKLNKFGKQISLVIVALAILTTIRARSSSERGGLLVLLALLIFTIPFL